ncbi:MAG: pentapeptide repeat-containing protein [Eubacteriales bacterium]
MNQSENTSVDQIRKHLRSDCERCFGLCCAALYFAKTDGFPVDKAAGEPCPNMQKDYRCRVYSGLKELKLKGCMAYDCFGAGQRVAQTTYNCIGWRQNAETREQMFRVFCVMQELHEMLWYLAEACTLLDGKQAQQDAELLLEGLEIVAQLAPKQLLELNLDSYRDKANVHIKLAGEKTRARFYSGLDLYPLHKNVPKKRISLMGADLKKTDLKGADLRGAYLIAADLRCADLSGADLIGADMRNADIRGADLSHSIFLTQMQINAAKGDAHTKLPKWIEKPGHWEI